jgi:hypothetical protein
LFELSAAGTQFVVLPSAFVMHDEFKSVQTSISNWMQWLLNRSRFDGFIEELNLKYETNIRLEGFL